MSGTCKGCSASVRLAPGEVQRILADYLSDHPEAAVVEDTTAAARLMVCQNCPDLQYGTTCRHCGCLVEILARLKEKRCPAPAARW